MKRTITVATIYVDGRGYQGEDLDAEYETNAQTGSSVYNHNGSRLDMLRFGDTPMEIIGVRCLASAMERIMRRVGDKVLSAQRIEIRLEERDYAEAN